MRPEVSIVLAQAIMARFAEATGLTSDEKPPRRYLWTDAFALCNFLELYGRSGEEGYRDMALRLVEQVHGLLGRHRPDDLRTGWISGLSEPDGQRHPTIGGLRIGKEMNERRSEEPLDDRLEWDRDGQYFHYLTKWMHALNRLSRVLRESKYHQWAVELAKTAQARFTYWPSFGRRKRMYWKMSIDLTYPLVPSMGQHDPLDGYITICQLQATTENFFKKSTATDLKTEIADLAELCQGQSWITEDPLGIGGLLFDIGRLTQLMAEGFFEQLDLLKVLLDSSLLSLEAYVRQSPWRLPAKYRLAFRELGLSIGLRAVKKVQALIEENSALFEKVDAFSSSITALTRHESLIEGIEGFWLEPANQGAESWMSHLEINRVMLATSLAPDGFLSL
jgi:hypothetical protein